MHTHIYICNAQSRITAMSVCTCVRMYGVRAQPPDTH